MQAGEMFYLSLRRMNQSSLRPSMTFRRSPKLLPKAKLIRKLKRHRQKPSLFNLPRIHRMRPKPSRLVIPNPLLKTKGIREKPLTPPIPEEMELTDGDLWPLSVRRYSVAYGLCLCG